MKRRTGPHCSLEAIEALEERRLYAADFADVIDNAYFPLIPGSVYVYRGQEEGERVRIRTEVTDDTRVIQGVTTTVVRDREFIDGELVEDTLDFYAQDLSGNVWYFGEESKEIEDGEVVSTEGSWQAGVDGAVPGFIMKAHPEVGDSYQQEDAPDVAEDRGEVLGLRSRAKTPFGTFGDCAKIADTTPLEPNVLEHKFFAPGIGLVKAQDIRGGDEVVRLVRFTLPPAAFAGQTIDNPYLPMVPGTTYVYRGTDGDDRIRVHTAVTDQTRVVDGVTTTVIRDREFVNGELAEDTLDFFAQDRMGNVWYFGEESREIEDGEVVSTEGSWEAGVDGAIPGFIMKAHPAAGDRYQQENAPDIAEDRARVLGFGRTVRTPFATFGDCLRIEETNPLENDVLEHKFYAPGVGLVRAQDITGGDEVVELIRIIVVP